MLLDTTVFLDYSSGDDGARAIIEQIIGGEIEASVSPLTILDLWTSPGFDRRAEIGYAGMLSFLEQAPLSADAAKMAGRWLASVGQEERTEMVRYALVAATASEREVPVCTRDPEPFSRFYTELVDY